MYAIVRCGGRQEKASVDDVLTVDKLAGEVGSSVTLPAVLVVDDDQVISDPAQLSSYQVTAEIVGAAAGPKINMIHFRNKTGYRRRLGHRQKYTQVKITAISTGQGTSKARAASGRGSSSRTSPARAASGRTASTRTAAGRTASTRTASAAAAERGASEDKD